MGLIAGTDKLGAVYRIDTLEAVLTLFGKIDSLAFSPVADVLAVAMPAGVTLYDLKAGDHHQVLGVPAALTYSPDGRYLIAGLADGRIEWINPASGRWP